MKNRIFLIPLIEKKWHGVKIKEQITVKDIKILIGEDVVIIIPQNWEKPLAYIDFFAIIEHFLNLRIKIKTAFGLFNDPFVKLIRKKIKKEFLENFSEETLLAFFEGDNREAYYTTNETAEKILGIEIRYEEAHNLLNAKMRLIKNLMGKIGIEEKKALEFGKKRV